MGFFYDKKVRGYIYQAIVIFSFLALFIIIFQNTLSALQTRGISTGFSFLKDPANFEVIQSLIDFDSTMSTARAFVVSLLNTLLIAVFGIILATILGFIIGIARLSKNFLINKLATIYVEVFRNIPVLLQIFFWYHAVLKPLPTPRSVYKQDEIIAFGITNRGIQLPGIHTEPGSLFVFLSIVLTIIIIFIFRNYVKKTKNNTGEELPFWRITGIICLFPIITFFLTALFNEKFAFSLSYSVMQKFQLSGGTVIIPEFISLLFALVMYTASFIAETVRSGIQAVNYGQTEAAAALGLRKGQINKFILIPQALKVIIPPLINQYLNLTKNSSLAAAIAYPDIVSVFAGTILNQTGQALEIIGITMAIYLFLSAATSLFLNWYNNKQLLKER